MRVARAGLALNTFHQQHHALAATFSTRFDHYITIAEFAIIFDASSYAGPIVTQHPVCYQSYDALVEGIAPLGPELGSPIPVERAVSSLPNLRCATPRTVFGRTTEFELCPTSH